MASSEDKERKKRKAEKDQELRDAGQVPHWRNFHLDAGRQVRNAWVWIPRLRMIILVSFTISILALIASVMSVYSRPQAMLFLALPNGSIVCAPMSSPSGQTLQRTARQQAICDRLVPPAGFGQASSQPQPQGGQ